MGIVHVDVVAHGRQATEALARRVADAKHAGPLSPVTVVVPSNIAGLTARRLLASGTVGPGGLANVQFLTPFRLAELLAADLLTDRRALTNPVLGAAVRRALRDDPGPFAEVADHHATESALASTYAELSHLSPAGLDAVAAGPGLAPVAVRLFRQIAGHLTDYSGEDDVAHAAATRPDLAHALAPFGAVVWHLPQPASPALTGVLRAVLATSDASVIVAVTGEPDVDAPVLATCARAGVVVDPAAVDAVAPPVGHRIVSVTDADEEVRAVVRSVAALAEDGVPLDRMAVFYPSADPYLRTLQQQLAAAGIPANGPSPERLAGSVAGRTLLGALALPGQRWRRDRVLAVLSGGPVRHRGQRVHAPTWERVSREEGVVQDLADWRRKLDGAAARYDQALAGTDAADEPGRARALQWRRDDAVALRAAVDDLAEAVRLVDERAGWSGKAAAALGLLRSLLGEEHRRGDWPDDEQDAASRVEDALARLAALDELEPDPSPEVFRRALAAELDVPRGRNGRFGEGVHYGPLVSSVGHDVEAVFVLGMTEGQAPRPRRDDTMLPDTARALAPEGELPARAGRLHDEHRSLLAALASAPAHQRVLLHPRGDLRGGRERLPSRWLLTTASALAGWRVHSTDFASLGLPAVEVVSSFTDGVVAARAHGSVLDRDLAALHRHASVGGDPADHPAATAARRGFRALAARRSPDFTEWDGNLAGHPVPSPATGEVLSATRLEQWAECGFRYFLTHVLGLADRDDPERIVDLGPLDRGSGVHKVLELFLQEVLDTGPPSPGVPWSAEQRARVQALADQVFAEYEARGRTGRPVHWKLTRQAIAALLDGFLTSDDAYRSELGATPAASELAFGFDEHPPVEVALPDGRVIRFRGRADRVDRTASGHLVVSDYKASSRDPYKGIDDGDPVRAGTTLQLGLYAEAAAARLGGAGEVHSRYWMLDAGSYVARGYPWTDDRRERFVDVVRTIVDGIEQGVFVPVPGEWDSWRGTHDNCRFCAFDDVCLRDRGDHAEVKVDAPELAVRQRLVPAEVEG
jgi:ATP-dependent helicase/nuclease subunit B